MVEAFIVASATGVTILEVEAKNNMENQRLEVEQKTLAQFINECETVAETARRLQVSQQTVHRWKRGTSKPSRAQIRLARALGVDLSQRVSKPSM